MVHDARAAYSLDSDLFKSNTLKGDEHHRNELQGRERQMSSVRQLQLKLSAIKVHSGYINHRMVRDSMSI